MNPVHVVQSEIPIWLPYGMMKVGSKTDSWNGSLKTIKTTFSLIVNKKLKSPVLVLPIGTYLKGSCCTSVCKYEHQTGFREVKENHIYF